MPNLDVVQFHKLSNQISIIFHNTKMKSFKTHHPQNSLKVKETNTRIQKKHIPHINTDPKLRRIDQNDGEQSGNPTFF